jgi:hypothetical protein
MPEVAKLSDGELRELVRDCDLYERLLQGTQCPLRREMDEVVHRLTERHWREWDFACQKVEALAEDLELKRWHNCGAYVRMLLKRMESER